MCRRQGLSLIEVMVSMLVISLMAGVLVRSIMVARNLTQSSSQNVTAFGLCQAKLEQLRGEDYATITSTNYPAESGLRLTHLGGLSQAAVTCDRTVTIQPRSAPDRKEVTVTVAWQVRDRPLQQQLLGVIYP